MKGCGWKGGGGRVAEVGALWGSSRQPTHMVELLDEKARRAAASKVQVSHRKAAAALVQNIVNAIAGCKCSPIHVPGASLNPGCVVVEHVRQEWRNKARAKVVPACGNCNVASCAAREEKAVDAQRQATGGSAHIQTLAVPVVHGQGGASLNNHNGLGLLHGVALLLHGVALGLCAVLRSIPALGRVCTTLLLRVAIVLLRRVRLLLVHDDVVMAREKPGAERALFFYPATINFENFKVF
jgi:hypothetical protein